MRTPIIAGNWKMNNTIAEGVKLVKELAPLVKDAKVTVVVCPTATALSSVADAVKVPISMSVHRTCIGKIMAHSPVRYRRVC